MITQKCGQPERDAGLKPGTQLIPRPLIHADLPAAPALTATDEHRPSGDLHVGFGQGERLGDAKTCSPEHDDQPAQPLTVLVSSGPPHDCNDLFDPRWISWVATSFGPGSAARIDLVRLAGDVIGELEHASS
ncbi:MAG TPA: hypothetical protein VLS25_01000 [Dehalococcoidia bacterium]|nr:hypothetical protein [Dehalococcoidia bacterium]